jgi:DNA-binding LacI/PurR family transcriptional regulator
VKVPDDVGLMGFDNIDMLKYIEPSLATVSYPVEEIGVKAVECLLKKINDEKQKEMCVLEHKVIAGQSL